MPSIQSESAHILRQRAEETLRASTTSLSDTISSEETLKHMHELQVHQIELEMQNAELRQVRDELETTLEMYTDLYDFAPVGYLTLDREGTILVVNLTGASLFGVERSRLSGRRCEHFISAESRTLFADFLGKVFSSQVTEACEVTLKRDGISPIFVQIKAVAAEFEQVCRIAIIDITERKLAEIALKEQKEFSQNLLQNSAAPIFVLDAKHKVVIWNRACENLTGVKAADVIGSDQHWKAFYDRWRPVLADLILDGKQGELSSLYNTYTKSKFIQDDYQAETWFNDNKGVEHYILFNAAPIRNSSGEVIAVIETLEDITEIKKAENRLIETEGALKESESKFKIIAEQALIGIFMHQDGRFNYVNPKFAEIFGYSVNECIGTKFQKFIVPEDIQLVEDQVQRRLSGENPTSHYQFRGLTRNKEVINLELYDSTTIYNKKLVSIGTLLDISDRVKAEEEKLLLEQQLQHAQKLESLGVLAGGIAHDFNNILTSIVGNADLALMKINPGSPVINNLHNIETAAARAADLAKQMLAYSGKGKFIVESLDLGRLLEEILPMLEVSIFKKAVLRLNLSPNLPPVEADATQIHQVIMNLVINASEAIGDKSGVIAISTGCMNCDKNYLKGTWLAENIDAGLYVFLDITDTGCGMDKETLAKVFDPFFTTKFTGRGLGMSAVMGIVRGHKGAIRVYSEPNKGTTFKILLPASGKPAEVFNSESLNNDWKGGGKVLLVDDEETVRGIGKEMLQELGYTTITANDGREAAEIFKQIRDITFVILDLTMPHMDGEQCFLELKQIKPDVKVIMSSGFSEHEVTQKFIGKGLAGFIQKPYKMSALKESIQKI